MNFDNKKIMPRFFVVIVLMSLGGLYILGNAAYLMFVESEYWTQVSRKLVKENVPIPAKRGNILSADGQIMALSLIHIYWKGRSISGANIYPGPPSPNIFPPGACLESGSPA